MCATTRTHDDERSLFLARHASRWRIPYDGTVAEFRAWHPGRARLSEENCSRLLGILEDESAAAAAISAGPLRAEHVENRAAACAAHAARAAAIVDEMDGRWWRRRPESVIERAVAAGKQARLAYEKASADAAEALGVEL